MESGGSAELDEDPGGFVGPVFPYWQKQPSDLINFHLNQEEAQRRVAFCVQQGGRVVDLSALYLHQIRTPTLRPLRYHTWHQSLTPALQLDLSNNYLEEVPSELFHLKNLRVLSLRSNKLTEINPSVGELNNLLELNLAGNRFHSFPWELLGLFHGNLKYCQIYPNPIIHPLPSIWNYETGVDEAPCQVASTRIAFLDITGQSIHHWPPAPTSLSAHWPEPQADDEFLGPPPEERTKIPSLLELVLRACTMSSNLSQLPLLVPDDGPKHLRQLLQKTWSLREAGGQECSVCGNGYIIPRTEWIEWWYCVPYEQPKLVSFWDPATHKTPVPLLRRGCSWACWAECACPLIRGWHLGTV